MYIEKLIEMFREMVLKKDASLIPVYYHPQFLLYSNEKQTGYDDFLQSHYQYYASPIEYEIQYDKDTFLEQGEKIAGRVWITVSKPGEPARRLEVILIAQYKDGRIYRLWELSYPDWSKLPAFK